VKERCAVSFVLLFGLEVDSLIHLSPQQVGLLVSRHSPLFILSFALDKILNDSVGTHGCMNRELLQYSRSLGL
jgi:hypothetical protein